MDHEAIKNAEMRVAEVQSALSRPSVSRRPLSGLQETA